MLTVNTGETAAEWADATGGGGATSVVAYSSYSDTTSARDWRTESHAEVDNYDGNENVNLGSFTTATRDSVTDGAIVIPEDGTYNVRFGATAFVGNTSGNAEFWGRVRLYVNGTKVRDGEVGHSRGQIISGSGNFDNLSTCEVSCILDLDEDDELHATFESDQQNNSTTATLEMKVDIHKIGRVCWRSRRGPWRRRRRLGPLVRLAHRAFRVLRTASISGETAGYAFLQSTALSRIPSGLTVSRQGAAAQARPTSLLPTGTLIRLR